MKTIMAITKTVVVITMVSALIVVIAIPTVKKKETLTLKTFDNRDKYLNKRIDSLRDMLKEISARQDTMLKDLDTLKRGQKIIFDEVRKNNSNNFWSLF